MKLFILRHADAEPARTGENDRDRALTDKGREQSRKVGRFLRTRELTPDAVFTSPCTRARQTAEVVCEEACLDDPELAPWLAPGANPEDIAAALNDCLRLEDLLIVGHQPDLGRLAAFLMGLPKEMSIRVRKSQLVELELERPTAVGARLLASVPVLYM